MRILSGIARENGIPIVAVGGAVDHVHLLISLPRTTSIAKAVQLLKSGSSKWIHENFSGVTEIRMARGVWSFLGRSFPESDDGAVYPGSSRTP